MAMACHFPLCRMFPETIGMPLESGQRLDFENMCRASNTKSFVFFLNACVNWGKQSLWQDTLDDQERLQPAEVVSPPDRLKFVFDVDFAKCLP